MGAIFAVTSGKGGVGKSTVSVGISAALAQSSSVLLIDMDLGLRCLDLMLGVSNELVFDINDVLTGNADLNKAVLPVPQCKNLQLLAASFESININPDDFSVFINEVSCNFDYIILDFPAGINFELYKALPESATFITVCTNDAVSIRDSALVANKISEFSNNRRLIINKFLLENIKSGNGSGIDDIIDSSLTRLLGIVPFDNMLYLLSQKGKIVKRGKTKKAFLRISKRLQGENIPLPNLKKI